MRTTESKAVKFLCASCRERPHRAVMTGKEFHFHCPHNRLTVIESMGGWRVVFDQA